MFESAELGHKIGKARYAREAPKLREALLQTQYELKEHGSFPVIIMIAGLDGAGKGETIHFLHKWLDTRLLQTHAFDKPTEEERERPDMWRFWRVLPPKGSMGILYGGWYADPIEDRVHNGRRSKNANLDHTIDEIVELEKMLVREGALLIKLWFHLSKDKQESRFKTLQKDPATRWRVTETDWKHFELYDKYRKIAEHTLRRTSIAEAPWILVEGEDANYRHLTTARAILDSVRARLDAKKKKIVAPEQTIPLMPPLDGVLILDRLDLSLRLSQKNYDMELEKWQGKLSLLMRHRKVKRDHALVAVFEGHDAAGKGGSIRRVTAALDARDYQVIPIAAPTDEERAQPYLWRFWRHLPRRGEVAIYDRSWYGRVLVERVEGLCSEADWMRAYDEINDFEEQLTESGNVVVKFWLAISKEEQLARFEARQQTSFKRFKITEDDWRNRKKWDSYAQAVHDMVERTSTEHAPWTLIEAEDKRYARVKVLSSLVEAIERSL